MNTFKYLQALIFVCLLAISNNVLSDGFSHVYIFGDSLSDQGNLYQATTEIIDVGIPKQPEYYQGRFSDGKNYLDFLATRLGLQSEPSLYGGFNFAFGGTRTDYNVVEDDSSKPELVQIINHGGQFTEDLFPWSLRGQIQAFSERKIKDEDGLYIVFSGSNDLSDLTIITALIQILAIPVPAEFESPQAFSEYVIDAYIDNVVSGIDEAIKAASQAGANDIIVANMPNLGVTPRALLAGPGFSGLATYLSFQYNQALENMLVKKEKENKDKKWEKKVNIIRFDTFSFISAIAANPAQFGFDNVTEACYSGFVGPSDIGEIVAGCNPETWAFWDNEHPTSALHSLLAQTMLYSASTDTLNDLMELVHSFVHDEDVRNTLASNLAVVLDHLSNGFYTDASDTFDLFSDLVNAAPPIAINPDHADQLNNRAAKISELLTALAAPET